MHIGTNPFASMFDGQETSSGHNESQSAPSNVNSRDQGGSGRKRKQSHVGAALEEYVEFKKSQTKKTRDALDEKKNVMKSSPLPSALRL
uniref:No apical meristem-associated C-terminal domain-containing protein n=1 Tax=Arundo donax TaxID=35708 RepID=A0A0A9D3W4_ARUDO